jgi:D-arabinose 1-dehydrogenase-like Zn-dependent alcohol dehydrogenase
MTLTVKAAYAQAQSTPIALDLFDLDGPGEGEVLIEIRAAGLCHSDMSFFDGSRDWSDYPIVLGHEGAGVVPCARNGRIDRSTGCEAPPSRGRPRFDTRRSRPRCAD